MAANPSAAQAIVSVAAITAAVAAATLVQPENVIDYTINKTSNAVTSLDYNTRPDVAARRNFLQRGLLGVSRFVDENALALEWKVNVLNFDEKSPISSAWIVRGIVGLATFWVARRVGTVAMR